MTRREFVASAAVAAWAGPARFGDGRDWFFEKRFGLFVHWGLYAIPAWHEQHLYRKRMTRADYAPLVKQFNPVRYRPDDWLDAAQAAGMEYVCFTAKHVDGFCLWDSAETEFKVTRTPYGKDVLNMLAEACHRRGMPLCLYYSVVDENQRNYPSGGLPYELPAPAPGDEPDETKYKAYVKRQIRELCTRYGKIHGIWWDANVRKWRDASFREMIRELQPAAVINNRGFDDGDFGTPERDYDKTVEGVAVFPRPTEACESIGQQSWGWRADEDYYSVPYLVRNMQKSLAKGGNYLLNVGPMADGRFPEKAVAMLKEIGGWYGAVKESFAEPAGRLAADPALLFTKRGTTLYAHVTAEPASEALSLHPLAVMPKRATLLWPRVELKADVVDLPRVWNQKPDRALRLRGLPQRGKSAGWVVKLEFERDVTGGA